MIGQFTLASGLLVAVCGVLMDADLQGEFAGIWV